MQAFRIRADLLVVHTGLDVGSLVSWNLFAAKLNDEQDHNQEDQKHIRAHKHRRDGTRQDAFSPGRHNDIGHESDLVASVEASPQRPGWSVVARHLS